MSIRDKGSLAKDKRIKTNKYSNKQIKVTLPIKNKQKKCPLGSISYSLSYNRDFQPKELMFNKTNDPHLSDDSHQKKSKKQKTALLYILYSICNHKKELLHHTLKSKRK